METIETLQKEIKEINDKIYKLGLFQDINASQQELNEIEQKIQFWEGVKKFKANKIINLKNQN